MNKEETYLFVDGSYLKKTLEEHTKRYFEQSLSIIFDQLGKYSIKHFYYDALPQKKPGMSGSDFDKQFFEVEAYFSTIASHRGWHVNPGITKGTGKKLRQKGVDVALAVDAFSHSVRRNCRNVLLLAGDLDFLPLIQALVREGVWVELWHDPNSTSTDLKRAADSLRFLNLRGVLDFCVHPSRKPDEWHTVGGDQINCRVGEHIERLAHEKGEVKIYKTVDDVFIAIDHHIHRNWDAYVIDRNYERLMYFVRSEFPKGCYSLMER